MSGWSDLNASGGTGLTAPVVESEGGTSITTYATGDILYAITTDTLAKLAATTNGFILKLVAGLPAWAKELYATVQKAGTPVTQRPILNFIDGSNITITAVDNSVDDRTDVTIAATVAASVTVTQTEIDFGASLISYKEFTITDAAVSATSKIIVQMAYVAPTGKDLDEVEADRFYFLAAPGTGDFVLYAECLTGRVKGKFKINYMVA